MLGAQKKAPTLVGAFPCFDGAPQPPTPWLFLSQGDLPRVESKLRRTGGDRPAVLSHRRLARSPPRAGFLLGAAA